MKKRLFISINLPSHIKDNIAEIQQNIDDMFEYSPFKWQPPELLHLTIYFLGDVNLSAVKTVCDKIDVPDFEIRAERVEFSGYDKGIPSHVWIKCEENEKLRKLHNEFTTIFGEIEEFIPHITIGTIRKWQFKSIEPEELPNISEELDFQFSANSIKIIESKLSRIKPKYTEIANYPLS